MAYGRDAGVMKRSGAIFKQGKVDPEEVLAAQEKQRLSLLKGLSRSIKEVQVIFANLSAEHPGQACITDCRAAQRLCAQFEDILRHGLKPGWFGGESTFWPVVLKVSRKQAITYIKGLQYAQTDNGRCRAWIRLAVNECSLVSYINVICQDSKLLAYYYEAHSFLRTQDLVSALTQQLIGLTELNFRLMVDTASLEFEAAPEVANSALPKLKILEEPKQPSKGKESRKGRKVSSESKENGIVVDNTSVGGVMSVGGVISDGRVTSEGGVMSEDGVTSVDNVPSVDDVQSVGGVSSVGGGSSDSSPTHTRHSPSESTSPCPEDASPVCADQMVVLLEFHDGRPMHVPSATCLDSNTDGDPDPHLSTAEQEEPKFYTEVISPETVSAGEEPNGQVSINALDPSPSGPSTESEELPPPQQYADLFAAAPSLSPEVPQESSTPEQVDNSPPGSQVSDDPAREQVGESVGAGPADDSHSPPCDLVMEEIWMGNKERKEDSTTLLMNEDLPGGGVAEQYEATPTDAFMLTDSELDDPQLMGVVSTDQHPAEGEHYIESIKRDRESVVSRDTLVNEEGSQGSQRSSRDPTPTRKSTNPFLESDEEEVCLRKRFVTNPFAEDDPPTLTPSHHTQAHDRPVSFNAPLSPKRPPSNPFFDDDTTPMVENATTSYHGNRPHLQQQSSVDSVDTPTIEKLLPPVPPLENSIDRFHNQFDQQSNETTPSISPVSFLREQSPDTASTASSQDLSAIVEIAWEQVPYPTPLGPSVKLSPTEDHFGAELTQPELIAEIGRLKTQLKAGGEGGVSNAGDLRKRIVTLQLRLQQMRDAEEEGTGDSTYQEVFGHRFVRQPRQTKMSSAPPTCEGCKKQVRGIIRHWYLCKSCGCASHKGCLSKIARRCNQLNKIKEDATYTLKVCPEVGLTQQKFRCGSCTQAFIGPKSGGARLCDYSGLYHCRQCHLNDESVIPARVVHNWDFKPRKVCSHCSDLLSQLSTKALIQVKEVNPHLYTHVTDLSTVESVRVDLLTMKTYFMQCRLAREAQLLQQLNQLLHFITNASCYSLSDLQAVQDGTLLPRLQEAHKEYSNHIKEECPLCSGKGYVCELCGSEEVLFPFDRNTRNCDKCKFVFHKSCFTETTSCPRCTRLKERFW